MFDIDRIDTFFITQRDDLINQFIVLQDKFRIKTDYHEQEQKKEARKALKKKNKGKIDHIEEIIEEVDESAEREDSIRQDSMEMPKLSEMEEGEGDESE